MVVAYKVDSSESTFENESLPLMCISTRSTQNSELYVIPIAYYSLHKEKELLKIRPFNNSEKN